MALVGYSYSVWLQRGSLPSDETFAGSIGSVYVPADFDTKEKPRGKCRRKSYKTRASEVMRWLWKL